MACQTQIDNMLKKDFSISSNNLLYSHRLSMIKRKNELLNNVSNLFESLISEKEFKQIKHLISNPIRDNLTFHFENNYFDLDISLLMERKNVISLRYYVMVNLNQYSFKIPYQEFFKMLYSEFKQRLLSSDRYNFCFQKSKYENMIVLQQSFC